MWLSKRLPRQISDCNYWVSAVKQVPFNAKIVHSLYCYMLG